MKKLFIIGMLAMAGFTLQAQPSAGQIFVGGNFGFYTSTSKQKTGSTTYEDYTLTNISIMPVAGYFLSDKMAVGVQVGITSDIEKHPDNTIDKRTSTQFHFEPFGRYYLISGTGGIFAEASFGIGVGKAKAFSDVTTTETNLFSLDIGISPGIYYYIIPKLALEAKFGWFGFSSEVEKDGDYKDTENTFGLSLYPSNISLGFTYTL